MAYKIETGIDLPSPVSAPGKPKYPWREMQMGDSFFVPLANGDAIERLRNRMANSARYAWKSGHGEFTTRTIDGGVRVWKTKDPA